jgi:anti-sigma B factor antagonist
VERIDEAGRVRLRLVGALDAQTVDTAAPELEAVAHTGATHVVLDLSRLERIDGSGIGAIVALFKRLASSGRRLGVEGLTGQPRAVFRLLKLDRVLGVE